VVVKIVEKRRKGNYYDLEIALCQVSIDWFVVTDAWLYVVGCD